MADSSYTTPAAANPLSPFRSGLFERVARLHREGRLTLAVQAEVGNWISLLGERVGSEALVLNPWVYATFHRGALESAPFVVEELVRIYPNLRSAVDLGSGTGVYMHELHRRGISVAGFEYSAHARKLTRRRYGFDVKPFDLNNFPGVDGRYDLSVCIEMAHHLTIEQADVLLDHLVRAAPRVMFSSARPNQEAHGSANRQPREWWAKRFAARGARLNQQATARLERYLDQHLRRLRFLGGNIGLYEVA